MNSRQSNVLKKSVIACALIATALGGCRCGTQEFASAPTESCNCSKEQSYECRPPLFARLRMRRAERPFIQNSPYNLPQANRDDCGCQSAEQSTTPATSPNTPVQTLQEIPTDSYEGVPELPESEKPTHETNEVSSRSIQPLDAISSQTIAQMQPPVDEPLSQPVQASVSTTQDKSDSPEDGSQEDTVYYQSDRPTLADIPAEPISQPTVEKMDLSKPVAEKSATRKPGALFEEVAEELLSQDFVRDPGWKPSQRKMIPARPISTQFPAAEPVEPLDTNPTQVAPEVKEKPADDLGTQLPALPQKSQEVFGAIQFDAVLREVQPSVEVYTSQPQDSETKEVKEEPALVPSKPAVQPEKPIILHARTPDLTQRPRATSSYRFHQASTGSAHAARQANVKDIKITIRPLPTLKTGNFVADEAPFEFRTMPAYHMPTLRAIPASEDRSAQNSVFKIHHGTSASESSDSESSARILPISKQQTPLKFDERTSSEPVLKVFPHDPEPMIRPLPRFVPVQHPATNPSQDPDTAESVRGLTNRKTNPKPLR